MGMSKFERELAVYKTSKWIAQGFSKQTIYSMLDKDYGIRSYDSFGAESIEPLSIAVKNKIFSEASKELITDLDREAMREYVVNRFETLANLTEDEKKYKDAADILEKMTKLLGLQVDKTEVKVELPDQYKVEWDK